MSLQTLLYLTAVTTLEQSLSDYKTSRKSVFSQSTIPLWKDEILTNMVLSVLPPERPHKHMLVGCFALGCLQDSQDLSEGPLVPVENMYGSAYTETVYFQK